MRALLLALGLPFFVQAHVTALLLDVKNDFLFHFSYENTAFYCRGAAIDTIEQMTLYPNKQKVCIERAQNFIKKFPYSNKQYAYKLHKEQKYKLVGLKDECFVMLNGGVSFSEHLLEQGFAKLRETPDLEFFNSPLYRKLLKSQERASYHKRGIWNDPELLVCF